MIQEKRKKAQETRERQKQEQRIRLQPPLLPKPQSSEATLGDSTDLLDNILETLKRGVDVTKLRTEKVVDSELNDVTLQAQLLLNQLQS